MSDEDAIERCKQLIKVEHANWIGISNQIAIGNILDLIEKQDKIIDLIVNTMVSDEKILALVCKHIINKTETECYEQNKLCDDCIKEYFKKKVEENI